MTFRPFVLLGSEAQTEGDLSWTLEPGSAAESAFPPPALGLDRSRGPEGSLSVWRRVLSPAVPTSAYVLLDFELVPKRLI